MPDDVHNVCFEIYQSASQQTIQNRRHTLKMNAGQMGSLVRGGSRYGQNRQYIINKGCDRTPARSEPIFRHSISICGCPDKKTALVQRFAQSAWPYRPRMFDKACAQYLGFAFGLWTNFCTLIRKGISVCSILNMKDLVGRQRLGRLARRRRRNGLVG